MAIGFNQPKQAPSFLDEVEEAAKKSTPTYKPVNMAPGQVQLESGGQQHDKSGAPLVGRYRDGSTPKDSEKAYGAAQMQIGTARNTAKKHGIPWDQDRFMNDADYNLLLGDKHKGDLKAYYKGDAILATAAYHSGTGNVDKAIQKYGRDEFWRGLGPHGRDYVKKLHGVGPGASWTKSGGKAVASNSQVVAVEQGKFAGVTPSKGPNTDVMVNDVDNAFSLDPKARLEARTVTEAADFLTQAFNGVNKTIQQVQTDERQLLESKVAANQTLLDAQAEETQARMDTLRPIFARRAAIAERKVEIQNMGFLERTFAGIFNRNYDEDYLNNLDSALVDQVNTNTAEWQAMSQARENLGAILNERYTDESSLNKQVESQMLQNLGLAQTAYGIANTRLQSTMQQIQTDASLIQTQDSLKQNAFEQIVDTGTVTTLLAQAQQNGGQVVVNGIPVTEAELITHGKQVEQQEANYELLQLSIAHGKQGLIDRQMESVIAGMTPAQRTAAAQNGGVDPATGMKLNPRILTEYLEVDSKLTSRATASVLTGMDAAGVYDRTYAYTQQLQQANTRASHIFGGGDTPLTQTIAAQSAAIGQLMKKLKTTPEGPVKVALEAQVNEMLGGFQAQQEKVISAQIGTFSRDVNAQALMKGYITGTGVSPEQAVKGFLALTKGGTAFPKLDPRSPAAPVIAEMTRAVQNVYDRNGGEKGVQAIMNGKNKDSATKLQADLMTAVKQVATSRWANNAITEFVDTVPQWAAADKHPAGRIRTEDIRMARAKGDEIGYERLASRIGWTPDEVKRVFGPKGAGVKDNKAIASGIDAKKFTELKSQLSALQVQGVIQALDTSKSAVPGFRPSTALADFMMSNAFQGRVNAYSAGTGRMGFAENTVLTITGGQTLGAQTQSFARAFGNAASQNDAVNYQRSIENANAYRNDPIRRAKAVIAGLEGFDPASEAKLLDGVMQWYKSNQGRIQAEANQTLANRGLDMQGNYSNAMHNPITAQIVSGKFEDPQLESLRKKAAAQWMKTSSSVDRAMNALE